VDGHTTPVEWFGVSLTVANYLGCLAVPSKEHLLMVGAQCGGIVQIPSPVFAYT